MFNDKDLPLAINNRFTKAVTDLNNNVTITVYNHFII